MEDGCKHTPFFHFGGRKNVAIFCVKISVPKHSFGVATGEKARSTSVTYFRLEDAGIIPLYTQKLVHFRGNNLNKMGSHERKNKQE